MFWPRKRLKKVPLPWCVATGMDSNGERLHQIIRCKFDDIFGGRSNISTKERIIWGEYLSDLGVCWEIKAPRKFDWEGWETAEGVDCILMRPKGLEKCVKVGCYYIPRDLAFKILVLGWMP